MEQQKFTLSNVFIDKNKIGLVRSISFTFYIGLLTDVEYIVFLALALFKRCKFHSMLLK